MWIIFVISKFSPTSVILIKSRSLIYIKLIGFLTIYNIIIYSVCIFAKYKFHDINKTNETYLTIMYVFKDYNMFDLANEEDQMEQFLKLEPSESAHSTILATENNLKNGDSSNEEIKAEQLQETDTTENESKEKDISNDGESKADETSSNVINETEDIEVKKDEADIAASGDAAVENGKEEEEEAETTREPSPEKAEE